MDSKVLLLSGAALIAGRGFTSAFLMGEDKIHALIAESEFVPVDEPIQFAPTKAQRDFQTMAVTADLPECPAPRPPNNLSPKAYVRNSYAAILDILVTQRWQETGSCECSYGKFTWDNVVSAAPGFERTDGIELRFDFLNLRAQADDMLAQRAKVCSD